MFGLVSRNRYDRVVAQLHTAQVDLNITQSELQAARVQLEKSSPVEKLNLKLNTMWLDYPVLDDSVEGVG
jgi:hypothetical protein